MLHVDLFSNHQVFFSSDCFSCRVRNRADLIGAFKMEPLYLKHENQESGTVEPHDSLTSHNDNNKHNVTYVFTAHFKSEQLLKDYTMWHLKTSFV